MGRLLFYEGAGYEDRLYQDQHKGADTIRQEVLMQELGVDKVYIDRMSGKNSNRPELQRMMEYVCRGDTVIVESISRFAR